uniref:Uncharacterized protein n=1 Tax=Meloidogyne enterolobii TaxID=390850 RepID=A0A6V7TQ56_MELEN|nr:unnamed protein product [Meloidogyne enterolobii]
MSEEELSNSDLELKVNENKFQIKFVKEKTLNLEEKNFSNEIKLKEIEKKILNLNTELKKKLKQINKNFNN